MKLLVLAPGLRNTSPGSRFRIEQWMELFAREDVETTYVGFEDEALHDVVYTRGNTLRKGDQMLRAFGRRLALLADLRQYDAVFIYEEASRIGPALIERLISWRGKPVIYDFCDPVYLPYKSPTNRYLSYLKFFGKTAAICRLSARVIVGNPALAEYARRYTDRVTVVPITIDTSLYTPRAWPDPPPQQPVIGWSGSHTTLPHLDGLRDVLVQLRKIRNFRLRVIGAPNYQLQGVETDALPWKASTEIGDLKKIDIGIMPLPDDPWTRLRTHLKVRQYMGLGIPCVVSPVGVNAEVIDDGRDGFLARSSDEWIDRLTRLIDDAQLRQRLGAAGRQTIENRYSAQIWAPRVLGIIREAVAAVRLGVGAASPPVPPRQPSSTGQAWGERSSEGSGKRPIEQ